MFRLIAQLLIVPLLTLNIAWAVDACALTDPGAAGGTSIQADGEPPADPTNAGRDCDDWCHAWANPVALPGAIVLDGYAPATTINGGFYTCSYSSLATPPPFHPPIT